MAAAQVSGAAALILSRGYQPATDLRRAILDNVDAVPSLAGKVRSGGRLDICAALEGCTEQAEQAETPAPQQTPAPAGEPAAAPRPNPGFQGRDARIRLTRRSLLLRRGATVSLPLLNANSFAVKGSVLLRISVRGRRGKPRTLVLSRKSFELPAGQRRQVKVKLSKHGRSLVRYGKRLSVLATVVARDPNGAGRTITGRLALRRPPRA